MTVNYFFSVTPSYKYKVKDHGAHHLNYIYLKWKIILPSFPYCSTKSILERTLTWGSSIWIIVDSEVRSTEINFVGSLQWCASTRWTAASWKKKKTLIIKQQHAAITAKWKLLLLSPRFIHLGQVVQSWVKITEG